MMRARKRVLVMHRTRGLSGPLAQPLGGGLFVKGVGNVAGRLVVRAVVLGSHAIQITVLPCFDLADTAGVQVNIAGAGWEDIAAVTSGGGSTWEIATTTEIGEGDEVLWQYTGGEDSILDCINAEDVGALGPIEVTNPLDLTAPTLLSAEIGTVSDDVLVLTFDEPVYSAHPTTGWTLLEGANPLTITGGTGAGTAVLHFTIAETILEGQTLTVSYDADVGDITDVSGYPDLNALADITDAAVTNNVAAPTIFGLLTEAGANLTTEAGDRLVLE